jgi:AcrR family transcriptional regulator
MARNKYPEQTVDKILNVSLKLFLENGYEKTSIQNIIDGLGGLSKGAIYHHFKSKDEILLAVIAKFDENTQNQMDVIREDTTLSGAQKLCEMFCTSADDSMKNRMIESLPNLLDNPHFLALYFSSVMNETVPKYILPVIEQGIADGSLKCVHPKQTAEVLMLLTNVWMNPLICKADIDDIHKKKEVINKIMESLGLILLY